MKNLKIGDRIKYRLFTNDPWKEDIVVKEVPGYVIVANNKEAIIPQPSTLRMLRPFEYIEDYIIFISENNEKVKENICTCSNRALFNFGCPSIKGFPCINGK